MIERLEALGRFGRFAAAVGVRLVTPPWELTAALAQIGILFRRCLLPVLATTTPLGMVMALQGLAIFDLYGAQRLLSPLVSVATFRELSPVLASVLVAAQGGSSFAAELGAMRISEEIDATEVMAIDALRVHVVPRFAAIVLACPLLNFVGSLGGIVGGWISAVLMKGEPSGIYWTNLFLLTQFSDLWGGAIKALVFGAIIGLTACYQGFYATGGAPGVGRAVNDTVVLAATTFIVANYFLTTALFGAIGG
ncbi:MAG: ABC transporter permease [Myxococcales bacterium]|nr:ABC transporter permease [Myxococcales bacterium]